MCINFVNQFLNYSICFPRENLLNHLSSQNKKIGLIAAIAFSCLALCYFIYCHTIRPKTFAINPQEQSPDLSEPTELEDEIKSPQIRKTPIDPLVDLQNSLLDQVHSCQAIKNLYQLAEKTLKEFNGRELQIKIVPSTDSKLKGMRALCNYPIGEIWISSKLDDDQAFSTLIFELANMTQTAEFVKIHETCCKKEISRDEYILSMEQTEYVSILLHTTTIKDAMLEKGADWKKYDIYHSYAGDETFYLNRAIDGKHTDYYVKAWDDTYGKL